MREGTLRKGRAQVRTAAMLAAAALCGACGGAETPPTPSGAAMGQAPRVRTGNEPPVLDSVTLEPTDPRPGQLVRAVPVAHDPDGDAVTYSFAWRIGGAAAGDSGAEVTLDAGIARGARLEVTVIPRDGKSEGRPKTVTVAVGNQAPELAAVALDPPGDITRGHPVVARPRAIDADGDVLSYRYSWRVNGEVVDGDSDSLDTALLKRGDTVQVRVVAHDGSEDSEAIESPPLRVANAEPKFTSQPTGFDADGTFRYTPQAVDPDGDRALRFRLEKAPEGMTVDGLSGALAWQPRATQMGRHDVELVVEDRQGGSATQRFALSVADGGPGGAPPVAPAALAPGDDEGGARPAATPRPVARGPGPMRASAPAADEDDQAIDSGSEDQDAGAAPTAAPTGRRPRPAPAVPSPPAASEAEPE